MFPISTGHMLICARFALFIRGIFLEFIGYYVHVVQFYFDEFNKVSSMGL